MAVDMASVFSEKTGYEQWVETEGVPTHRGFGITDPDKLELATWKRLGAKGAYVVLEGCGGTTDAYLCDLSPGQKTNAEKHMYEKWILVLKGEGGDGVTGWVGG